MWDNPAIRPLFTRLVCLVPMAYVGILTVTLYIAAHGVDVLSKDIPNGRALLQGMLLVGIAGCIAFSWNLILFPICTRLRGRLLGFIGIFDLVLTVLLIAGIVRQAAFLPHTYARCDDTSNWRNASDSDGGGGGGVGVNFFVAANETQQFESVNVDYDSPDKICFAMVQTWVCAIAFTIIYGLCALQNMFLGFSEDIARRHYHHHDGEERKMATTTTKTKKYNILQIPWILYPFAAIFVATIEIYSSYRFLFRCSSKFFQRVVNNKHLRPMLLRPKRTTAQSYSQHRPPPPVLPHEIWVMIASHLHYADLVSLSRVSRSWRGVFIGGPGTATSTCFDELRPYTCEGTNKTQCRVCSIQICESCLTTDSIADSDGSRHLTCRPYCSRCFYTEFSRQRKGTTRRGNHVRHCRLARPKNKNLVGYGNIPASSNLCRFCAAMDPSQRQELLQTRDAAELRRLVRHPLACDGCKTMLSPRGPRWWICAHCGAECRNPVHPSWA